MAAAALFAVPEGAHAQSFWNWGPADYSEYRPARPKRAKIKRKADPAEAVANKAAKPVGPLVIAVSVERQRVKIYDSNGLFAEAPVSTGTKSHPTPMGVFSIIQKNRHHVSNLYGASMPYMQRITWSGVAMHTGPLPGYAASHGCIRLPNEFAARLWTWTRMGTRVIVAPGEVSPANFSHPKLVAKIAPPPTVSAVPATTVATSTKSEAQRTADARDAIAGMKGTLTDVAQSAPARSKGAEAQPEAKAATAGVAKADETAKTEASTAEKPVEKVTEASGSDLAVQPEDRTNTDDSVGSADRADAPAPNEAEPKSVAAPADTKPVDTKPADAAREIAKPADIAKSPEIAKPAETAAPVATPAPAKPAVVATPRRQSHVAVFISRKDKKLYIRHGYEPVFDIPVEIAEADRPLGTHVFTARGDKDDTNLLQWSVVSLPQVVRRSDARRAARQGTRAAPAAVQSNVIPALNASEALDRITIPAEAMERIAAIISPGGSLLISDHGLNGWETGRGTDFIVPLR
jgi:hypothetical protein